MKISYKAALLSAFVFPGVGQFYLKRYWRGLVIMLIILTGLGYMIWSATVAALSVLDDKVVKLQGGTRACKSYQILSDQKCQPQIPIMTLFSTLLFAFGYLLS